MEKIENFDGVPADAQQVLRVRPSPNSGKLLKDLVTNSRYDDRHGYWDAVEDCGYLWNAADRTPEWQGHIATLRMVGGIIEWVRPAAVNVNPSGQAPTGWHFPN